MNETQKAIKELKSLLAAGICGLDLQIFGTISEESFRLAISALEENDRLEYEKRFAAVEKQKYIEIIDSFTIDTNNFTIGKEQLNSRAKKKVKKTESIEMATKQAEVLSSDFWELSTDHIKTLMELQKVKYQCKDWELEAKKAVAKLGEIRILMDGGKRDNKVVWKGEIEKSPYCPKCNYPLTLDGEPNYCTECGVMLNWEADK